MSERCLHLHGGLGKTATTSLQKAVFSRHAGLHYFGKRPGADHVFTSSAAANLQAHMRSRPEAYLDADAAALAAEAREASEAGRVLLWSDEGYSYCSPADQGKWLTQLADVFGECRLILFLREPFSLLESLYFFDLKRKNTRNLRPELGPPPVYFTMDEYFEAFWDRPDSHIKSILSYGETVRLFASRFGAENVKLILFEQFCQDPAAQICEMFRFMGLPGEEAVRLLGRAERANERWTVAHIRLLKSLQNSWLRARIFRALSTRRRRQYLRLVTRSAKPTRPEADLASTWRQRVLELTVPQNEYLAGTFGLPLDTCWNKQ